MSLLAQSGQSRQRNKMVAIGQERTLTNRCSGYFLGPSTLLSTIFRASAKASAGVENGIVAYIVTMKPAWRLRSRRWKL
jgi:hypothetical protein